jgi:hypothetical protein
MPWERLVVVALTACGAKYSARTGSDGTESAAATVDPRAPLFGVLAEHAVDPRAAALMTWVVPLKLANSNDVECSATAITPHELITAAHCVDGGVPPEAIVDGTAAALTDPAIRACQHTYDQSCLPIFPEGDPDMFRFDVATVHVAANLPPAPPRLGRIYGDPPNAFMLSAHAGFPLAVCRAQASFDTVNVSGEIDRGDSGSAVVALRHDGVPVVLGIVSHRLVVEKRWYFAVTPSLLPWPLASDDPRPVVDDVNFTEFSAIQDCP